MLELYVHPNTTIKLSLSSAIKYAKYNWQIDNKGTIFRHSTNGKITLEFCLKLDKNIDALAEVHYKDGNRLNLTLENLQEIPFKLSTTYSSYQGVSWENKRGKWIAQLTYKGTRVLYKRCNSEIQALEEVNKKRIELGLQAIEQVF